MKNIKTKFGITLTAMACFLTFGCSPQRLEEPKKPKIEYPGMSPYNISREGTDYEVPDTDVISYAEKLLRNTRSAKKGLTSKIPLNGELASLKTFYGLGVPKNAEKDKDGFYMTEYTYIIRHKELRQLNPKEIVSFNPVYTKDGKVTVIEYDYGLDKKIDFRIIIQKKYFPDKDVVTTQELDIGADGTIEERLITSLYEGYTFEKALDYKVK